MLGVSHHPRPLPIALGTVPFGLAYGATNTAGQVPEETVRHILTRAAAAGVVMLDTAAAYGTAEEVLGRLAAGEPWRVMTKTLPHRGATLGVSDLDRIAEGFHRSLTRLRRSSIDTLLVHHANDLVVPGGEQLAAELDRWKAEGLVRRLGVSIYDRAELDGVLARMVPDLVQLPASILDQRLVADGTIDKLARLGIAIHLRSAYLQGLLLAPPDRLPERHRALRSPIDDFQRAARAAGLTPAAAALGFLLHLPGVEAVVVGATSPAELEETIAAARHPRRLAWSAPPLSPHDLDPRRWIQP